MTPEAIERYLDHHPEPPHHVDLATLEREAFADLDAWADRLLADVLAYPYPEPLTDNE